MSSGKFTALDDKLSLFSLITAHVQLLLGLGLYFISPLVEAAMADGMGEAMKSTVMRFWLVEHIFGMVIGIALITVGRIAAKRATEDNAKFKKIAVYFSIGLLIILATIPWPFREVLGRGWF
jgi:dipeptide/tripeptide permease